MIYTFYSFKGGVGRSMALANIAECFYLKGLKVVMLDWDLEAPGLESFFFEREAETTQGTTALPRGVGAVQSRLGLIDLLTEYKRSYSALVPTVGGGPLEVEWAPKSFRDRIASELNAGSDALPSFSEQLDTHLSLSTYLYPIHEPSIEGGPALWLLPAGWRHRERFEAYAEAVQAFDWEDLYVSFRGKEFFDWMRAKLLDLADLVLIDSRTGVTEMGGVCARQLADVVVSFCAPNSQNVDGVARMVKSFKRAETMAARDNRTLETVVIPTRVDPQEVQKLEEFLTRFGEVVNEDADAPRIFREVGSSFWDLRIPYRTIYSYEERRVIGPGMKDLDPTRGLETAYRRLAAHLALLAPEDGLIRQRFSTELQQWFPALLPKVGILYEAATAERASEVRTYLDDASIGVWADPGVDPVLRTAMIQQVIHLVLVTSDQPDPTLREHVRLARQLGRWVHVVGPPQGLQVPVWLQGARIYRGLGAELRDRLRASKPTARVPMMVPPVPGVYVDRPELRSKVTSLLLQGASKTRACYALWGEGGSGKSVLAAAVASDDTILDAFPDGVLWIYAADPAARSQLLTALTGEGPAGDVGRLPELLRGRRALLVIDDAWTMADVAPWMDLGDRVTRLVLTRNLDLAATVAQEVVTVGPMTPTEAAQLLTGSAEGADLATRLGRLPLALTLARTVLDQHLAKQKTRGAALEELDAKLDLHGVLAFDVAPDQAAPGSAVRNQSVAASIDATLAQLADWQRRRLYQLVERSNGEPVAFEAVSNAWDRKGAEAGEPHPFNQRERQKLLQFFSALALIEWDAKSQSIQLNATYRNVLLAQGVVSSADRRQESDRQVSKHRGISSGGDRRLNPDVDNVKRILGGQDVSYHDAKALFKRLKNARYFGYCRQLLARMGRMPAASNERLWVAQQWALCTYKDTDLGSDQRSKQALEILNEADPLESTTNQETLGLAGAIYKYRWMADGQLAHLERSAAYYLRGYAQGIANDYGYTAINAAFVLDTLAHQADVEARKAGAALVAADQRRQRATQIRKEIADELQTIGRTPEKESVLNEWFLVTLAEALFGLDRHEEARFWLREALALEPARWAFESTARQLAELARVQNAGAPPEPGSPAAITLRSFLGNDAAAVESVITGRVGLALSGGGFRASLFHIGVLARLAELDLLRRVEVISCVSGGSIIGAHYYLEVRKLLQSKGDADITREDYIDIVKRLERDFVVGVQRNLRSRLYANPWISLKCLVMRRYNRTDRLAELFESAIFSRVDGKKKQYFNDLTIQPPDAPDDFSPKLDNWRRTNKAPILIVNATTLNTGHNWQFTATWMGEPPAGAGSEVDTNDLLRRMYYWEAPKSYRSIRLGRAVAASACVPGLFEPVELDRLFPSRRVQLVDGGVHDNQGIAALLEQECSVLMVSDASGQMESLYRPSTGRFQSLKRSSNISMARVREIEYRDLDSRFRSSQIKGLMFLHLKKGLEVDPIDWIGCTDPFELSADAKPVESRGPLTPYGLPKTIQERLAGVRTDLDSFTDAEAYSLMYSGYRMAGSKIADALPHITLPSTPAQADWAFLSIEKTIANAKDFEDAHEDLGKMLTAGRFNALKVWRLRGIHWLLPALIAAAMWSLGAGGEFTAVLEFMGESGFILAYVLLLLLGSTFFSMAALTYAVLCALLQASGWRRPWTRLGGSLFMLIVGWVPWALHQHLIDPLFLLRGAKSTRSPKAKLRLAWKPVAAAVLLLIGTAMPFVFRAQEASQVRAQAFQAQQNRAWQQAVVAWDQVIELDPNDSEARLGRAWSNRELGQYPQAIADYDRALELQPRNLQGFLDRAFVHRELRQYELAASDYDRALLLGNCDGKTGGPPAPFCARALSDRAWLQSLQRAHGAQK